MPQTLLILVDGLGLGPAGPDNPLTGGRFRELEAILAAAVPVDASMGVPGRPQSATGQTALITGCNAARALGMHKEGFPNAELKRIIQQHNVFRRLKERGYRCAFANAYFLRDRGGRLDTRRISVTTAATLAGIGWVRDEAYMERGEAVYQDVTRELLRARGYDGPVISEKQAASDLVRIAGRHDFTLFEYFQTDIAGHSCDRQRAEQVLGILDRFLAGVRRGCRESGLLLVLISDHGNIEDLGCSTHTLNPVPLFAEGPDAHRLRSGVRRLEELVPVLLELYPPRDPGI